jgi:nitrate reductase alpha subunit
LREVPATIIKTKDGKELLVTTAFDLTMAQAGVSRGLDGDYPEDYDDPKPYTPAWQEAQTGVSRDLAIQVGREFAENAEKTKGKSLFITGPGIQHF